MEEQTSPMTGMPEIDREQGRMADLWEDSQAQQTCPVRVPLEQWQTFLRLQRETWEMLEEEYPEDEEARNQELRWWMRDRQPEPITLSERLQIRIDQVREQMRVFEMENSEFDESSDTLKLYHEALHQYREFERHQVWLHRRLEQSWEPETATLQGLDRELWVAENLWSDRASPEPEIEDRLWEEAWRLETRLMDLHPL